MGDFVGMDVISIWVFFDVSFICIFIIVLECIVNIGDIDVNGF